MKKALIYLLIFLPVQLFAQDLAEPDSVFNRANQLYKEEAYEEAIENYLKIIDAGYESAELYFNTGNAYFRSNKLGKARLFYERAKLLDPGDEDIQTNLEYTESLLTDRFEEVPELFIKRWIKSLINSMNSNGWLIFSLFLFGAFLIAAAAYIFVPSVKIKRLGFFAGIVFFLLTLTTFTLSTRQYHHQKDPETAIVMEGSLVVKSAPRESGKDLFILHEGTKVWLENYLDEWVEVRITDGRMGWVRIAAIEEI
ncbi:MAG: tetratricopeptide repeat protein [Bacteroidales bacterium]